MSTTPETYRVAAVQMDPKLGENAANLATMIARLREAASPSRQVAGKRRRQLKRRQREVGSSPIFALLLAALSAAFFLAVL